MDNNQLAQIIIGVIALLVSLAGLGILINPQMMTSYIVKDSENKTQASILPNPFMTRLVGVIFLVGGILVIVGLFTGVFNAKMV